MDSKNIVPFGKYKGKQIEELVADTAYVDWLTAQPWLKDRFPSVYQLVINYQPEPAETPEHNVMQARFLSEAFQDAFVKVINPEYFDKILNLSRKDSESANLIKDLDFEANGMDIFLEIKIPIIGYPGNHSDRLRVLIEIKPSLGDDYPAVLRQIKQSKEHYYRPIKNHYLDTPRVAFKAQYVLIVGTYQGDGATWNEVVKIFALADIKAILMSDIEANLPETP